MAGIGSSRLAVHTTVRLGMLLYHMPRYKLALEPLGEKKPSAKSPALETSVSPEESGFAFVSCSSDLQNEPRDRRMKIGMQDLPCKAIFFILPEPTEVVCGSSEELCYRE